MRKYIPVLLLPLFIICSCSKTDKYTGDTSTSFVVEGYLIKNSDKQPRENFMVALSQGDEGQTNAPKTTTDSNGYFKIEYTPSKKHKYITLHRYSDDYCIFSESIILKNLPKGQDLNLGRIYY